MFYEAPPLLFSLVIIGNFPHGDSKRELMVIKRADDAMGLSV
jgi:rRNA pseudouridine-1189 N-methylase Emg1 (Nep1/Mra1 family)